MYWLPLLFTFFASQLICCFLLPSPLAYQVAYVAQDAYIAYSHLRRHTFLVGLRCRIAKVCLNSFTLLFVLKVVLYEKLYPAKKCATLSVSAFWLKLLKSVCFALFDLP